MRGLAVLTIVFVFATAAPFVGPASAQGSGSLSGMVCVQPYGYGPMPAGGNASKDCGYGQGLPGAVVKLTRSGTLPGPAPGPLGPTETSDTTDANGYYTFSNLATGDYSVLVTRTGFQDASGTVTVASGSLRDFVLAGKAVEAKGKVTDADGAAIGKATVNLCCGEAGSATATTGTDGRYTASVQAGYWSVDVSAPGFQPTYQQLLVDGSDLDFKLERIPPQDSRIAGTVTDQDGRPIADARVAVYGYGACCYAYGEGDYAMPSRPYYGGENHTFTDANGKFSIGAYAGENQLSVTKDGYATRGRSVVAESGKTATADVELLKYPEKTARITGKVVDAETGKPVANVYLNLNSPAYGLYECSQPEGQGGGDGSTGASSGSVGAPKPASDAIAPEPYPMPGCAITTRDDGTFEGMVTPGYGVLSVYADWYASCSESSSSDGSFTRSCGPEYYSWVASQVLAADETTTFDVRLRSRPAPDAEVSGYVIDAETGQAIPGAQVSFSNQDTYGWGSATTDQDGSYRLRLRSGYHTVSVWAEGHLGWQGVVDVPKGDSPFDVTIQPGEEAYCCSYGPYYGGVAYAEASDTKAAGAPGGMVATSTSAPRAAGAPMDDGVSQGNGEQYEDLGGGLGPYDAESRRALLEEPSNGSPGVGLVALLAAVGAVLALRRRMA